jgi:CBS domain containing-hemolysin-like protein
VVIGEMIPKSLALQSAERTIMVLYQPMSILEKLFLPFVKLLNNVSIWITQLFGIPPRDINARLFTPDELEFIVEESYAVGLLDPSDQLFIENILDLEERNAEQIMTPRNKIHALPVSANFETAMNLICKTNKTRYPVYEETLDNIVGILHIKDLARFMVHKIDGEIDINLLIRPTIYIPETFPLDELLIRFRRENHQVAITLDEFGGTAGLVTLEDLVEEVVGEIQDEFDEETQPIEELPGNIIRVRGDVVLGELEQHYKLDWKSAESNTVGGLVMYLLGKIPKPNDIVMHQGIKIVVESVEGRAVKSLLIYLQSDNK